MVKGDLDTPLWFNEFTAGGGGYYGTKGRSRMWAYLALMNQAQTVLAWTFNSHQGGEEQALFGLVDHDGTPSWKVDEFAQIAAEFCKLQGMGFPYPGNPQVAIAYAFDNAMATTTPGPSATVRQYYTLAYQDQVQGAFEPFFTDNIDAAIVNIAHADLAKYKLVVVPGHYIMSEKAAAALRRYVNDGGTALMTGYSAKADEHGLWFNTPLPGRLADVFGLRTNAFYRSEKPLEVTIDGKQQRSMDGYYEVLVLDTATPLASFANTPEKSAAVSVNRFGKGQAIYLATACQASLVGPLARMLYKQIGIVRGPETPSGVYARVVDGRTLYVNTTTANKVVRITGSKTGALSGKRYTGTLRLAAYGVELLQ